MGFNSAFKIVKNPGNGRLNNLNDPVLNVLNYVEIGNKLIYWSVFPIRECTFKKNEQWLLNKHFLSRVFLSLNMLPKYNTSLMTFLFKTIN